MSLLQKNGLMIRKNLTRIGFWSLVIIIAACSISPKEELEKRKITINELTFLDSVSSGNNISRTY